VYRRVLKLLEKINLRVDGLLNAIFAQQDNPYYFTGGFATLFFWILVGSGILLFMYYVPTLGGAYASVQYMTERVPFGGVVRGIHRYAADAMIVAVILHGLRYYVTDRYRKWRSVQWISGIIMMVLVWIIAVVGYMLVWDERSLLLVRITQIMLDATPGVGGMLVNAFLAGPAINDLTLPRFLFLHVGPPLLIVFLLWVHYLRINRPVIWPTPLLIFLAFGGVFLAAGLFPATSDPPAYIERTPTSLSMDWFYLLPYWLATVVEPGPVLAGLVALTAVLIFIPYYIRDSYKNVAFVIPEKCTGCTFCEKDCHANAITMVPYIDKRGRKRLLAQVNHDRCAECGICVGACPFYAIELPLLRDKDFEAQVTALWQS
jgi:quinol-cytochrome oxidoreductase complex cytochrome b subunit